MNTAATHTLLFMIFRGLFFTCRIIFFRVESGRSYTLDNVLTRPRPDPIPDPDPDPDPYPDPNHDPNPDPDPDPDPDPTAPDAWQFERLLTRHDSTRESFDNLPIRPAGRVMTREKKRPVILLPPPPYGYV